MAQILQKKDIQVIKNLKAQGKKIVLCHGVFDLVHPGHILHFEEAKKMGDILVVSITAAKYVRKGPGRPYFDDEMRMKFLSEIACIDYVMLSDGYTVDDIIETVEPDLYVKGQEYAKPEDDITGKIGEEVALVRAHGGEVAYTTGQVFSSTRLINKALPSLPPEVKEYMEDFHFRYSMDEIKAFTEKIQDKKVLVLGDAIIDEYIYSRIQGLMSKDTGYSARFYEKEQYLGGALAIARHVASFCENVTLMTVVGNEDGVHSRILDEMSGNMRVKLTISNQFPTIVKTKYVEANPKRAELNKLFAVNNLPDPMCIDEETMQKFKDVLLEKIKGYDLVILCDFGHGLVDEEVQAIVEHHANFLALNCQTNSSNYGKNIITKYHRANAFTLDQKELGLAFSDYRKSEDELLLQLSEHLQSGGFLTRGSSGAECVEGGKIKRCPALTLQVKDTIGAGDAFFSVASLYAAVGAPYEVAQFMGNIAGALASNIVGNKEAVEKVNVLKYASTLLNV
ncbi:rfaE bifunctional protein, domain II [Lachnospiraceae bacterium XBB1006]|nr:rfaE bifunctional protein, domain II [Lachnospiraceae bacterium XBB1006]